MEGSLQRRKKSFLKTYHTRYKFISLAYIWFILLSLVKYLVKATMEDSLTRIDLIGHVVNIEEQGGTNCMIFLRNYKFCYRNLNHKSSTSVCHIAHKSSGHCRISMRLPKIAWRTIFDLQGAQTIIFSLCNFFRKIILNIMYTHDCCSRRLFANQLNLW